MSLVLPALLCLVPPAASQVDYALTFEPGGKLWNVAADLPGRGEESLDFRFPVWTPGAYHPARYGRFVEQLTAADGAGKPLEVQPDGGEGFRVLGTSGAERVVIRYTARSMSTGVFSNDVIDVEANRIAAGYAYVNPVSLFGFLPERAQEEIRLRVDLPEGWRAETVLERDGEGRFVAPSYYRLEDSPLLFSPTLESADFVVDGKSHRVSVHGRSAEDVASLAEGCRKIVEAGSRLMGGLPYDRYQFLFGFVPEGSGSGLEHSFSTLILLPREFGVDPDSEETWGITAHEYFHLWCAERIHVQEIHHPDLLEPVETGTIWVNEGITEYFCRHLLLHAGFLTPEKLLEGYLHTQVPLSLVPKHAWTDVSRATVEWAGMQDLMAFAMRMYMVGPSTIFALDMTMRRETGGDRGILDLLRYLMANYVAKDRGFEEDELDDVLATVSGPQAVDFYRRYIDGDEIPDPAGFLDVIGYRSEDGRLVTLDPLDPAQERARRDYFSVTGEL